MQLRGKIRHLLDGRALVGRMDEVEAMVAEAVNAGLVRADG